MRPGRSGILRLFRIVFLVLKFFGSYPVSKLLKLLRLRDRLGRRYRILGELGGPTRVRLFLQEVDGALIKIGQIMAMRVDFLPAEYVQELLKLLDEVPPFSSERAREIVEEGLGGEVSELFESFDKDPMASASFAQVHAATLPGGKEVVVKVQRPDVPDTITADLRLFRILTFLIDATGLTRRTPLKAIYDEFSEWTREELDYRIEGSHIQEVYEKAKGSCTEKIPKVYWRLTTERVLTLERLRGIWVKEIMQQLETDRKGAIRRLKEHGTSLQQVSENMLRNTLRQIFEYGVYHSDPHAANLLLMKGGRIGYVDFGITGRIGYKARQQQVNTHVALESGDFERFYNAILDTIEVPFLADLSSFKRQVAKCYKVWLRAQYMGSRNSREKSFARLMLSLNQAAQTSDVGFRSPEVRIFRTLATVDAILLDFAPNLDVRAEFRRFFTHYSLKALAHEDIPQILQKLPAAIRRMAEHLDVEVVHVVARVSKLRRALSRAFRVGAFAVAGIGALALFGVEEVLTRLGGVGIERLEAVLGAVLGAIFFFWLAHMLHLRSVVHDEVVLPAKERISSPAPER